MTDAKSDEHLHQANGVSPGSKPKNSEKNGESPSVVLVSKKLINEDSLVKDSAFTHDKKANLNNKLDTRSTSSRDDVSVKSGHIRNPSAVSDTDLDNLSLASSQDAANDDTDHLAPLPSPRSLGNVSASTNPSLNCFSTNTDSLSTNPSSNSNETVASNSAHVVQTTNSILTTPNHADKLKQNGLEANNNFVSVTRVIEPKQKLNGVLAVSDEEALLDSMRENGAVLASENFEATLNSTGRSNNSRQLSTLTRANNLKNSGDSKFQFDQLPVQSNMIISPLILDENSERLHLHVNHTQVILLWCTCMLFAHCTRVNWKEISNTLCG